MKAIVKNHVIEFLLCRLRFNPIFAKIEHNVCFKKTVTINSTVSLLWIVTVFLKQTFDTSSKLLYFANQQVLKKCKNCTFKVNVLCQKQQTFYFFSIEKINFRDHFLLKNIFQLQSSAILFSNNYLKSCQIFVDST